MKTFKEMRAAIEADPVRLARVQALQLQMEQSLEDAAVASATTATESASRKRLAAAR